MTDIPYTHGHDDSVLRSHRWRTAENSAGLPAGPPPARACRCSTWGAARAPSPADLARRVAPGRVIGIDAVRTRCWPRPGPSPRRRPWPTSRSRWAPSSTSGSPTTPSTWSTPTRCSSTSATRWPPWSRCAGCAGPAGVVAARDGDYPAFRYFPDDPDLDRAIAAYGELTRVNGANWDAGRPAARPGPTPPDSPRWSPSASAWCFATPEERGVVGRPVGRPVHPVGPGRAAGGPRDRHAGRPRRRSPPPGAGGRRRRTAGSPCSTARCWPRPDSDPAARGSPAGRRPRAPRASRKRPGASTIG